MFSAITVKDLFCLWCEAIEHVEAGATYPLGGVLQLTSVLYFKGARGFVVPFSLGLLAPPLCPTGSRGTCMDMSLLILDGVSSASLRWFLQTWKCKTSHLTQKDHYRERSAFIHTVPLDCCSS